MLDPATDVDLVAGASISVANVSLVASTSVSSVSGYQYQLPVSLPQLLVPLHQLPVSRLLVPKLPVRLPRLPVFAGALAGVQVLCHGCRGY